MGIFAFTIVILPHPLSQDRQAEGNPLGAKHSSQEQSHCRQPWWLSGVPIRRISTHSLVTYEVPCKCSAHAHQSGMTSHCDALRKSCHGVVEPGVPIGGPCRVRRRLAALGLLRGHQSRGLVAFCRLDHLAPEANREKTRELWSATTTPSSRIRGRLQFSWEVIRCTFFILTHCMRGTGRRSLLCLRARIMRCGGLSPSRNSRLPSHLRTTDIRSRHAQREFLLLRTFFSILFWPT